jgi:hypothetical protein
VRNIIPVSGSRVDKSGYRVSPAALRPTLGAVAVATRVNASRRTLQQQQQQHLSRRRVEDTNIHVVWFTHQVPLYAFDSPTPADKGHSTYPLSIAYTTSLVRDDNGRAKISY